MTKKLCLALVATLLALFAVELAHRSWLWSQDQPHSIPTERIRLERLLEREESSFSGEGDTNPSGRGQRRVLLHPYFGFYSELRERKLTRDIKLSISNGRRGVLRILVLGGSVAAGFGNHGCAPLEAALRRDPRLKDREFDFMPYGVAAFKQPQQLNFLNYVLALGMEADLVINLDGFNEVAVSSANMENGFHPILPSSGQWASLNPAWHNDDHSLDLAFQIRQLRKRVRSGAHRALASPLLRSSLLSYAWYDRLQNMSNQAGVLQTQFVAHTAGLAKNRSVRGPAFEMNKGQALQLMVRSWRDCSEAMALICDARGIHYLNTLQPTLHDEGSKPATLEERKAGLASGAWRRAAQEGYPLLRQAGTRLSRSGVHFLDATQVFSEVEETLYYDACHFNERGNAILAEAIAESLLAYGSLDLGKPAARRPRSRPMEASSEAAPR